MTSLTFIEPWKRPWVATTASQSSASEQNVYLLDFIRRSQIKSMSQCVVYVYDQSYYKNFDLLIATVGIQTSNEELF